MTPPRTAGPPPVILVEGSQAAFERATAEAGAAGWRISNGFAGPFGAVPRDVRSGTVATAAEASSALLAILGGAGAVIHCVADRDVIDRLVEDLRHVGPVEQRRNTAEPAPVLDQDERAILRCLAEGQTLGEAANTLGLSRRTADRRLADARRALGVERTVEAVAKARRLGWLA